MAKIFSTSEDIEELAINKFNETGLAQVGLNLKVMSITKSKNLLKVSRGSATTEFLTGQADTIHMVIYEEAFDRMDDKSKEMLMEGALSNVSYDSEKDKIIIESNPNVELYRMRRKYPNYIDVHEAGYLAIRQLEEEEKEKKAAEKEAKKHKS